MCGSCEEAKAAAQQAAPTTNANGDANTGECFFDKLFDSLEY